MIFTIAPLSWAIPDASAFIVPFAFNSTEVPSSFNDCPGEQILTIDDENQKIEVQDKQGKEKILIDGKTNSVSITGDKKIELASKSAKLLLDGGANKIELTASQIIINRQDLLPGSFHRELFFPFFFRDRSS